MAFQKVSSSRKYFKYAECEKGQRLVDNGLYAGPEEGKYGVNHIFKQKDGQIVCLNSAGQLNWLLETHTNPGKSRCNVYYGGKTKLTKGAFAGKDAHGFELEVEVSEGVVEKHAGEAPAQVYKEAPVGTADITL